jgi:hypothetical protein
VPRCQFGGCLSRRRDKTTILASGLLIGLFLALASIAAAEEEASDARAAQLSREFTDPLTTLPQIFLQDAYTPSNYGTDAQTNRVIVRAIIPRIPRFSLFPAVQLIRPTFSLVTLPTGKGSATRTELGDMELFDLVVLPWSSKETGFYIAAGPVFLFPTATDKTAGQRSWQAGPGFGAIYKGIPGILLGGLVQNPISFAYTSPDARPTSTLVVQPVLSVFIGHGFYLRAADASWSMSWYRHGPTMVPLSAGIGYVKIRPGLPPINLFVTGEWMAYRQFAPFAPQTTIRFGLTVAFPGWRPWR